MKNILFFALFRKKELLLFIFKLKGVFSTSGREGKISFRDKVCFFLKAALCGDEKGQGTFDMYPARYL